MRTAGKRRASPGWTLIELMIVIAILGIMAVILVRAEVQSQRLVESEVALQKANLALRSEVEILRSKPYRDFDSGASLPFDERVVVLSELVDAKGMVEVESDPARPGLLKLKVEVTWLDPRMGMRSIHTMIYKAR